MNKYITILLVILTATGSEAQTLTSALVAGGGNMKFEEMPKTINSSLFKQETLINDAVDGLLRELLLDRANGFIGKTIIHPTHIPYVNGMLAVTKEVYDDAMQILDTSGGVVKSTSGNKMNEIGPHRCWAEKIVMRAKAYGVIENESKYRDLFEV